MCVSHSTTSQKQLLMYTQNLEVFVKQLQKGILSEVILNYCIHG